MLVCIFFCLLFIYFFNFIFFVEGGGVGWGGRIIQN